MISLFKMIGIKAMALSLVLTSQTNTMQKSPMPSLLELSQKKYIEVISSKEPNVKTIHTCLQPIPHAIRTSFIYKCLEDKYMPYSHKVKIIEVINKYDINIDDGDKEIMTFLIGINTELTNNALSCAIRQENIVALWYLVEEKKIPINQMTNAGKYPLHYAVEQDNLEIVTYLLEQGSDVNCLDNEGYAPLHFVKSIKIAQKLCEYKANVHIMGGEIKFTPIDTALLGGNKEVELFLRKVREDEGNARWR